jgi:hypothetical protein
MSPDDPSDDELLGALDQFTSTEYWLRARTDYTAAHALAEALDDWTAQTDGRLPDEHERDGDLGANLVAFAAATRSQSTKTTLAAALANWTSTISAEHHRSLPFQPPAPPASSGSSTRP